MRWCLKTNKDEAAISTADSSRFSIDIASEEAGSSKKENTASIENKIGSIPTPSVTTDRKSAV